MQTGQRLHGAQTPPTPITADSSESLDENVHVAVVPWLTECFDPPLIVVHEIAGVVPDSVINSILSAIGIETGSGMIDLDVVGNKNGQGYKKVDLAVKKVGRQGYSAGQVLLQVRDIIYQCSKSHVR
jgi:replication factor C subunit 2/4